MLILTVDQTVSCMVHSLTVSHLVFNNELYNWCYFQFYIQKLCFINNKLCVFFGLYCTKIVRVTSTVTVNSINQLLCTLSSCTKVLVESSHLLLVFLYLHTLDLLCYRFNTCLTCQTKSVQITVFTLSQLETLICYKEYCKYVLSSTVILFKLLVNTYFCDNE